MRLIVHYHSTPFIYYHPPTFGTHKNWQEQKACQRKRETKQHEERKVEATRVAADVLHGRLDRLWQRVVVGVNGSPVEVEVEDVLIFIVALKTEEGKC
jgi:hypothetical protein